MLLRTLCAPRKQRTGTRGCGRAQQSERLQFNQIHFWSTSLCFLSLVWLVLVSRGFRATAHASSSVVGLTAAKTQSQRTPRTQVHSRAAHQQLTWMGPLYFPSPLTALKSRSNTVTSKPLFLAASANTSPPMPPPATRTFRFLFFARPLLSACNSLACPGCPLGLAGAVCC